MHEIISQLPEIKQFHVGLIHIFILHTSASLTINENADPSVQSDLEKHFNHMVPDDAPHYIHTYEGLDDITAHIKNSILGSSVTLPIHEGELRIGTWQGIYLCEHRDDGSLRRLVVTIMGQKDQRVEDRGERVEL